MTDRGTGALPKMRVGEWLGGALVVLVIVGACWLADVIGYWIAGGTQ